MGFTITLHPSGRTFIAEPQESLLEAGLRSGINLPYRCNNGNCGECLAQVEAGRVRKLRHYDYVPSGVEKAQQVVLLCSHAADSDLTLGVMAAGNSGDIPHQQVQVKVVKREFPHPDYLVMHLRTPRSQSLRFLAGQHVQLEPAGHAPLDIAVASCPCNGMQLQFHLTRGIEHPTGRYLFEQVKLGESLKLQGPYGDFLLNDASKRPLVMLAVEMGFAASKSLLEHAINLDLPQPVRLYWVSAREEQRYLENFCRAWDTALDDYAYTPITLTKTEQGMYDAAQIVEQISQAWPRLSESDVYISASIRQSNRLVDALIDAGVDAARITRRQNRELPRQ